MTRKDRMAEQAKRKIEEARIQEADAEADDRPELPRIRSGIPGVASRPMSTDGRPRSSVEVQHR